ncbi:MAG TPA: hypothetical protein VF210_00775 [Pseudomonadales bacterium]
MRRLVEALAAPRPRLALMVLAGLLLAVSLTDPTLTLRRNTYDFIFTLDITGSMNVVDAEDAGVPLDRLTYAKRLVGRALARMPCGSRAGLAVFTEHRTFLLFEPIEICENHLVLSTMLERIDGGMAWAARSEVAKGLYAGIDAIAALREMHAERGPARTRLVFLTDGHEAPPVHPTLRPRFRGRSGEIGGLIAGIGGAVPMPIPRLDDQGRMIGYWAHDEVQQVDRHSLGRPSNEGGEAMAGIDPGDLQERIARGTEHLSSLKEGYLQQLAAETGLDYLRASSPDAFVRALLDPRHATRRPVRTRVAWIPAALGLLCLLVLYGSELPGVAARGAAVTAPARSARASRHAGTARPDPAPRG